MRNPTKLVYLLFLFLLISTISIAQRGYYDAPYKRYEADSGILFNGAVKTSKSYAQLNIQSEASNQVCVNMNSANATVKFAIKEEADGLVIRYSVPDSTNAIVGVYIGNTYIASITMGSKWSWEYLWSNGNPNNGGITNKIPRMRFDEVRYKLPTKLGINDTLKLVKENGNLMIDFIELENIPVAVQAPANAAIYNGNGSDLQNFIDANGGKVIFLPSNIYNVNRELYFGVAGTKLQGAGMWYTQLNFTSTVIYNGGIRANTTNISLSDLYLTTNNSSRSNSYKAINGVYTSGSMIQNVWAEHFECGAWIAQYDVSGPSKADGFTLKNCRFRNNYADGINLCKGTSNAIVEHCNFRNNGDDDQAIWSADGLECIGNTFRYNTSENCWRASGLAIYGGKNNKAHNLLIRDNLEVGIRVNNSFPGVGFNSTGLHELNDITIQSCGTFNDLYHNAVGAIDIFCANNSAGTQVRNISFKNIDILNSKNDAIYIAKKAGDGIYNISFENINLNGTAKEYPNNNFKNLNWGRGYGVLFSNAPNGNGTYCNMNFSNRGGNANVDVGTFGIGTFSWTEAVGCIASAVDYNVIENIEVYPNPASTEFVIDLTNTEFTSQRSLLTIYDTQGKKVFDKEISNSKELINVEKLPKDLYLITVTNGIEIFSRKLILN